MMDTINISTNYRVIVDDDTDIHESPDTYCDTVFYELDSSARTYIHEGNKQVVHALENIETKVERHANTGKRAVWRAMVKHMERAGYAAKVHKFPGCFPGDWCYALVAAKETDLESAIKDWSRWYSSEYYTLTLEKRHVWTDNEGNEMSTWDEIETVYEVELENADDSAEVIEYARDCFEIDEVA